MRAPPSRAAPPRNVADRAPRLLHITDTHLLADNGGQLRGTNTWRSLDGVLHAALSGGIRPDAVLATGDLSHDGTPASYRHFRNLLAPLGVPVLCLPGNHDGAAAFAAELAEPPFQAGGSLAIGRWLLLLLDSTIPGEDGGRIDVDRLAWLHDMLESHRDRHVLVALHHHVLPLGSRWLDALGLAEPAGFLAALDRMPQVRAVVSGHVHQASATMRHGVQYLTTPSTCFQFLPRSDAFALDGRPPGYRWLELHADGRLATTVGWDGRSAAAGSQAGDALVYAGRPYQPAGTPRHD